MFKIILRNSIMDLYDITNDMLNPVLMKNLIDNLINNSNLDSLINKNDINCEFILKLLKAIEITLSKYEYSFTNNIKKNLERNPNCMNSTHINIEIVYPIGTYIYIYGLLPTIRKVVKL